MTSLFDDLGKVPTPLSVHSREPLIELVKRAQLEILKIGASVSSGAPTNRLAADLRRYALWLDNAIFVENNNDPPNLEVAAALYEFAGNLTDSRPSTIFKPPLNDFIRSAIVSSATPFRGKASVVAGRVEESLRRMAFSSRVDQCHLLSARVIVSLLGRKFQLAASLGLGLETAEKNAIDELANRDAVVQDFEAVKLSMALARAAAQAASGMLTGVEGFLDSSKQETLAVRESADRLNDGEWFWLSDRIYATVEAMSAASMHRRLGFSDSPVPARYRQILAQEGFLEIWGPQLDALDHGILNGTEGRNFVFTIPTGAGKTLLAELFILSTLANRDSWGVYIAPSRSLVNQVSQGLRARLEPCGIKVRTVMAGAEQSFVMEEELKLLPKTRSVIVTTPEKLDTYYRNGQELFGNCGFLIIDEAHKVSDQSRGALMETLIGRFLMFQPAIRIALLSGVMTNPEEYVEWLGLDRTTAIVEKRRPTRQIFGIAVKQEPPAKLGALREKKDKTTNQIKTIRKVDYQGGIVLMQKGDDISNSLSVGLPNLFEAHIWERFRQGRWVPDRQEKGSPVTRHTLQIAEAFASTPGTLLVFFNNTTWVESCARKFKHSDDSFVSERRLLSKFIQLELGQDHELCVLCERGIAYHHASLPTSVQRAIEMALERGWLKIVFATSTLREGINTPATTVILGGLSYRDRAGSTPISPMDFSNLAGRAGRPRLETEGRIILVPDVLSMASAMDAGKKYLLSGEDARRVRSQLGSIVQALEEAGGEIEDMPVDDQRNLLVLKAAGVTSKKDLSAFIEGTLWGLQERDEQNISKFVIGAADAFVLAEERFGPRFELASKISLSLSSSELLRSRILEGSSLFQRRENWEESDLTACVKAILGASFEIPEVRDHIINVEAGVDAHLDPLLAWMKGETYGIILEIGQETQLFRPKAKSNIVVKYCASASNWLSWSFGAAWSIINVELEDPQPDLGTLPLLLKYGVPNIAAAYLSLLGVADRNATLALSRTFQDSGKSANMQAVSDWMDEVDVGAIFPDNQYYLRAELLRRQAFRSERSLAPYQFATFRAFQDIEFGTRFLVRFVENNIFLYLGDDKAGQVIKHDKSELLWLWSRWRDEFFAVSVTPVSMGRDGSLVAIRESQI